MDLIRNEPTGDELLRLARLRGLLTSGNATAIRELGGVSLSRGASVAGVSRQSLAAWERQRWTPRREWRAALRYLDLLDRLMRASSGITSLLTTVWLLLGVLFAAMRPDPNTEPVLSVERASEVFKVSRASMYRAIQRGEIPSIRLGRLVRIPTVALLKLLDEGSPNGQEPDQPTTTTVHRLRDPLH